MPTATTCPRHPDTETRLSCASCGTPICPRCAVETPVGLKCPSCVRQARGARRRGKPRQYAKGVAAGVAAAAGVALALFFVLQLPFLGWIASGFGGYAVGRAVRAGAEGNRSEPFRNLSMALAVAPLAAVFVVASGSLLPGRGLFGVGAYLAAVYGAYVAYR